MRLLALLTLTSLLLSAGLPTARASDGSCPASPSRAAGRDTARIRPYEANPRYWHYGGEPVLLRGGSTQDNLFQVAALEAQLDRLAAAGGNYVRNTMSARDPGDVWPFHRRPDSTYDLTRLNPEYFDRFDRLLRLAQERGIVVQIEVWDRFDFARGPWLENPFRPANNVNYTPEESGLQNEYPEHPGSNNNPFFRSIPTQNDNRRLLKYQQKRVDRLLEVALKYPNVLYTMDNETSTTPDWGAYWARYIKEKAQQAGVTVQTTEMWDAWDLKDEEHRRTLDRPALYDFADISQNNHNAGQEHWAGLQWVRQYTADELRPLNNVKIYGAATGDYGTTRDALERFWRNIVGGSASARFHRPASGIGLGDTAWAHLRSARQLTSRFALVEAQPDAQHRLLSNRTPDEAYLSYIPGRQYAVYFTDGGSVQLDLREAEEPIRLAWLNLETSTWQGETTVDGGRPVSLEAPAAGHWIALLKAD